MALLETIFSLSSSFRNDGPRNCLLCSALKNFSPASQVNNICTTRIIRHSSHKRKLLTNVVLQNLPILPLEGGGAFESRTKMTHFITAYFVEYYIRVRGQYIAMENNSRARTFEQRQ